MTHRFQNALKAGLHYFCLALCLCFSLTLGGCSFSSTAPKACDVQASLPVEEMDLSDVPTYDGDLVVTIHQNRPFNVPESADCSNEYLYSKLDDLGRTQQAYALLSPDSLTDSQRGDISSIKPTGFLNHAYDWIDGGTVYNRSHLIAHMLGGADIEDNLMTGTRSFNAFGMLPYEQKVQSYLNEEDGVVFYRVTPVYEGNDLVAKGAVMEAQSLQDQGEELQFCVFVYNVQPGIAIDYSTGENRPENETDQPISIPSGNTAQSEKSEENTTAGTSQIPSGQDDQKETFILNLSSKKIHRPDCEGVKKMKEKNKREVEATRSELEEQGYSPCHLCFGSC